MKLAFSAPTADAQQQRLLLTNFEAIGYNGLQLKGGQYRPHLDSPQAFLDEWGAYPTAAAAAVITGGDLGPAAMADLHKVFAFARGVGSELVVYCLTVPREGLTDDDIRGFAGQLSQLGAQAQQAGLKLSLHNHFDSPLMHRHDFDVFYDAVPPGTIGLTVDTAHLAKSGIEDIAEAIRSFAAVIDNFHLKDFAEGQWRVLGEGEIDFRPVFQAIRSIGYDGWVSTDEESGSQLLPAMESCLAFMKAGLGETGR